MSAPTGDELRALIIAETELTRGVARRDTLERVVAVARRLELEVRGLRVRVDALEGAARAAERWLHDPAANPLEQFERIGEEYYRATGWLRPGKSEPLECGGGDPEERRQRFAAWCAQRSGEVLAGLRAALQSKERGP